MIIVSDTTEQYYVDSYFTNDTSTYNPFDAICISDTVFTEDRNHKMWWRFGKEVMELHNTAEGQIDPAICPSCWHDYWVHKEYLDEIGYKLPKGLIVWQAVRRE